MLAKIMTILKGNASQNVQQHFVAHLPTFRYRFVLIRLLGNDSQKTRYLVRKGLSRVKDSQRLNTWFHGRKARSYAKSTICLTKR